MPKRVEECVRSVLEDNPDMDESSAWAICQDQMAQKLLAEKQSFQVGDWVSWQWQGETVKGQITGEALESRTVSGNTIQGEDGEEDVYELREWDEESEDFGSRVAKAEGSLRKISKPDAAAGLSAKIEVPEKYSDIDFEPPEAAQDNAQQAIDAKKDTGNPKDCGTTVGWRRARQLADGQEVSPDVVERMSQFARHESNSDMGDEGRENCGWMMWKAWGGTEGVEWAQRIVDQMETADTSADEKLEVKALPDLGLEPKEMDTVVGESGWELYSGHQTGRVWSNTDENYRIYENSLG